MTDTVAPIKSTKESGAELTEEQFIKHYNAVRSTLDLLAVVGSNNVAEELLSGALSNAAMAAIEQMDKLKVAFYRDLEARPLPVAQS